MRPFLSLALVPAAPLRSLLGVATAAALLALLGLPVRAADVEGLGRRVALVIGNGAYGDLGTLPNPPNDASDVADALTALDFDVTLVVDGDADAMRRSLREFGRSASGADVVLFYYAGHGMALKGENYLVPVRAQIENELDLRYETLGLGDVRDALDFTDAKLKMVILDACRDNPLARALQRKDASLGRGFGMADGLAPMDVEHASGMFIAYATAPGSVALDGKDQRNSPFTSALLKHIATPNTDVRVMFGDVRADVVEATDGHQTPWTEEAMLGEFEFNPVAIAPPPPMPPADYTAWSAVAGSDDPADLDAFVKQFPESSLAGAARDRLRILRDPATEAAAWDALQGSRDIPAYERFLHRYPSGLHAGTAVLTLQSLLAGQVLAASDLAGMEAFVARFPDATLTPLIRSSMEQLRAAKAATPPAAAPAPAAADLTVAMNQPPAAPVAPADPSAERALTLLNPPAATGDAATLGGLPSEVDLSPASVERLAAQVPDYLYQMPLKALGHYDGKLDFKFGPASRRAAAGFQRTIGAEPTGDLQPAEVVALFAEAARSGDPDSQNIYGVLFATGAGVVRDPVAAAKWYRLSAEADNGLGQMNLALLYLHGTGVARDVSQARRWLEAAQANGVTEAGDQLKELQ